MQNNENRLLKKLRHLVGETVFNFNLQLLNFNLDIKKACLYSY